MTILITGGAGQLGSELAALLGNRCAALPRTELDIASPASVARALEHYKPSAIINCAAYTAVDAAEDDPETARLINATGVDHLAEGCQYQNTLLVQISTDYVFGGDYPTPKPHTEEEPVEPRGVYAMTKWEGEQAAPIAGRWLVLRTCGLYLPARPGFDHKNFVRTMLRVGSERPVIRVVNDQTCTPTYVPHLAQSIISMIDSPPPSGVYHLTNTGGATWHEFASEIWRLAKLPAALEPIPSSEYPAKARRPSYSVLDTAKYHALGLTPMPDWREGLEQFFREQPQ